MENATKALLIAGGVLIAILIITLFRSVLQSTNKVSKQYNGAISSEQITTFNSNFTKYLGKDLTIHDVITICNFAQQNNTYKVNVPTGYDTSKFSEDLAVRTANPGKMNTYQIKIEEYDASGYISKVSFIGPVLK